MTATNDTAAEQATLWNGTAGKAWVESQELLDEMFKPFEDQLVQVLAPGASARVLDIGCGTGATTLAIARKNGPAGSCLGVDVSAPMVEAARARAEHAQVNATFVVADAQQHTFEPARFDTVVSRFGVMFFADSVAAFKNVRRASSDGAKLSFFAWRSAAENAFMTTAERSAAPLLPNVPTRRLDGPGQFAFADAREVERVLASSGWSDIDISIADVSCSFPERALTHYLTRLGPLGVMLHEASEETRHRVTETVRAAFAPYVHGAEVRFTAACWRVNARA